MDFEISKYEANASRLIHTIKSFIGSGIENLIIALFDNDSAACKEIDVLKNVNIPQNIKVMKYPNIEIANKYPCIGPSGLELMNINGLACGIELYLGQEFLKGDDGEFHQIQWTGYIKSINQYQGSLINKVQIQNKFRDKMKKSKYGELKKEDFKELIAILDLMNNAWKTHHNRVDGSTSGR